MLTVAPPVTAIVPCTVVSTVDEVEVTATAPAAAVVAPIVKVPVAVTPPFVTVTDEPPLMASAAVSAAETAFTAVVAAAEIV